MPPLPDSSEPRSFLAALFHPGFASDQPTPRRVIETRGAVALFLAIFSLATGLILPAGGQAMLTICVASLFAFLFFFVWVVCDLEINWRLKRRAGQGTDSPVSTAPWFDSTEPRKRELERAAAAGDVAAVAAILKDEPKPNGWEPHTLTMALQAALKNRRLDCARLMEKHLDPIPYWRETDYAFKDACRTADVDGVKFFLALGCDPFCFNGGAWGALAAVASGKSTECIDLIIDARVRRIAEDPSKDLDCDQPLITAAQHGTPEIIRHLLARGFQSKLNDFERDAGHPLNTPENPLLAAARSDYEWDTANLLALIEAGADIHVQDRRGATALHMAAGRNFPERVNALLEAGADPNCRDAQGGVPLHWAAESNRVENAKLLRQYGADLDAPDIDGTPPIDVAKRKNRQKILGYLRQWKKEKESEERVRLSVMGQSIDLPPSFPKPPRSIEWKVAAALLTRGELKAHPIEFSSLENAAQIFRFAKDRRLAEWILQQVPSIALPVYERVLPPLTDREGEMEDWELDMQNWNLRPMPPGEPRLSARVTAFASHPWGRIGVYLVVFDSPDRIPAWGYWYLRQPSARVDTRFPFFRLGDDDDAQLLFWMVMKPFLQKLGIVVSGLEPPREDLYAGPWHEVREILRFKEMPECFATVFGGGPE